MHKQLLFSAFLLMAISSWAQILKVTSIERVNLPHDERAELVVGISHAGNVILLSSQSQEGLVCYDLDKRQSTVISESPAAGFNARLSSDGKSVVFQEMSLSDDGISTRHGLKSFNIKNKVAKQLVAPTEKFSSFSLSGDVAVAMTTDRKLSIKNLKGNDTSAKKPVLNNDDLKIWLTVDGTTTKIAPQGDEYAYIWESLSPDMTKILYVNEAGCFVCDLKGMIVANLGELRAPKWIDNSRVVGMLDYDDGTVVTTSEIVVKTLDGGAQILTDSSLMGMWPQPANGKIAFSNPRGEIYMINFTK